MPGGVLVNPYRFATGGAWSHYTPITLQSSQIDSDLTSYEFMVDLSGMPAGFWSTVKSDGSDIRVFASDGTTEYAFELVEYNYGANTGHLWGRIPTTVSSTVDTVVRIYYGNAGATAYAVTDTYGRNNVWTNFAYVAHDGGRGGTDSTGKTTPTVAGSPASATGKVGGATTYDGTNDSVLPGTAGAGTADITVSAWIKTSNASSNFVQKDNVTGSKRDWFFGLSSSGFASFAIYRLTILKRAIDNVNIADGAWHFLAGQFQISGFEVTIRVDGTLKQTIGAGGATRDNDGSVAAYLGRRDDSTPAWYDGELDEVWISHTVFSPAKWKAWYINMNTPLTFYSVGTHTAA